MVIIAEDIDLHISDVLVTARKCNSCSATDFDVMIISF
jgi:hypothetical protein